MLKIQQEVNRMQEEIEATMAKLHQLSSEAQFSTINLTFFERGNRSLHYGDYRGMGSRVSAAFKNGISILSNLLIAVVTIWPLWLVAVFVLLIIRYLKRNRGSKN